MRISLASHQDISELRDLLRGIPGHELIWTAHRGSEVLRRCQTDPPDLLLLEMNLPETGGVDITRRIMCQTPCAILLITHCVDSNAAQIFEAMGEGALDVVALPAGCDPARIRHAHELLLKKLRMVARLQNSAPSPASRKNTQPSPPKLGTVPPLVVLGASTGGPGALAEILSDLPGDLNAAMVVVQHVNQEFSAGLVDWLDAQGPSRVTVAVGGTRPCAGQVYVAGTNDHLIFTEGLMFGYTPEPLHVPYRPSVDVCFHSLARNWPTPGMAVLLTGMGRDGARGLLSLRQAGWHTVAQDQASSVVYGMPKAARDLDAADRILPLNQIAPAIRQWLARRKFSRAV